ncbi:uncharacterized protein LOC144101464 [Amblyomma americanum]
MRPTTNFADVVRKGGAPHPALATAQAKPLAGPFPPPADAAKAALPSGKKGMPAFQPAALKASRSRERPLNRTPAGSPQPSRASIFRCDREQASRLSGGVAIIIQSRFATREIKLKTKFEAVAVTVIHFKTITICSIYLEPHQMVTLQDMETLLEQLPEPYLLAGDFNAHSFFWGSEETDTRGRVLEDFVLCNNVFLLNSGKHTYCTPSTGKMSCLVLSFSSPSVFTDFKWDVLDDPRGSDHLPIIISLSSSPSVISSKPRRWKLHLADWALFRENASLEKLFSDDLSVGELNKIFTTCIIAAARISIPQSSGVVRQRQKPWYSQECRGAKRKQNKAWGIFRRYLTHQNLVNFKKARAKARYIRRSAEKTSWQKYITSINSSITSKKMWEQVHKINGSYSPFTIPFFTGPGIQTSIKQQADVLAKHFSTISSSAHYTVIFKAKKHG